MWVGYTEWSVQVILTGSQSDGIVWILCQSECSDQLCLELCDYSQICLGNATDPSSQLANDVFKGEGYLLGWAGYVMVTVFF